MQLIQPQCRRGLNGEDLGFIQAVLATSSSEASALCRLMKDQEFLDDVLDHKALYDAVIIGEESLKISTSLYFYILVRKSLVDASIDDRDIADYVASVLVRFSQVNTVNPFTPKHNSFMPYMIDVISEIERSDYYHRFFLYSHLANQSLFFSGIYSENIQHREQSMASPGIEYYEAMGISHFKAARNHPLAKEFAMDEVYDSMYHEFRNTRIALNDLVESLQVTT